MFQITPTLQQEQALRVRPHLAFIIECLGLASMAEKAPHQEIFNHLELCLKTLFTGCQSMGAHGDSLIRWLDKAMQEFSSLQDGDFPVLLEACVGNTMPGWLQDKVSTELGDAVTELITRCLEC